MDAVPNTLLIQARLRLPSPSRPNEPMTLADVVDGVNTDMYGDDEVKKKHSAFNINYLRKLERGVIACPRTHQYRRSLRKVLKVNTDEDLGFVPVPRAERSGDGHRSRKARRSTQSDIAEGLCRDGQPSTADTTCETSYAAWASDLSDARRAATDLWAEEPGPAKRESDQALEASAVALRWLVAPDDETAACHEGSRTVGRVDIGRLQAVRKHLKAIDHAHGGGTCLPMATAYLRAEATPLLAGRYTDKIGRALHGAVAQLCLDVGWMAYDAAKHRLGRQHMLMALRLSHGARDRLFGGRVLAALSHQALHLGHVQLAVDLARAARSETSHLAPPPALAMFMAMEAMALAASNDPKACGQKLAEAEKTLDKAAAEDDLPPWLDFDAGGLAGHAARAYRYLLNGSVSAHYSKASITACLPGHSRTRTQRTAILAAAHLQLGEVDQASRLGSQIVTAAWQLRSGHVDEEVAFLARSIERTHATGTQGFLDAADEYLAAQRV